MSRLVIGRRAGYEAHQLIGKWMLEGAELVNVKDDANSSYATSAKNRARISIV